MGKKLLVAFDVDGTLRCNCTASCQDVNENIATILQAFRKMKNVNVFIWSGGGKSYAEQWGRKFNLPDYRCYSKLDAPHMDIAFDDEHAFSLADKNIIVREK